MFAIRNINKAVVRNNNYYMRSESLASGIISMVKTNGARGIRREEEHPNVEKNTAMILSEYPPSECNTIINFGQQGYAYLIERFGKFNRIEKPGIFLAIPIVEKILRVDTRQMVIDVARQKAYTSDNVSISVAAQLYITIMDSEKACYKVAQPLVAVMSQAQSALRTSIGKNDLDHLLKDRQTINLSVREALNNSVEQWGVDVSRFEITDLTPDKKIQEAMDLQSTAERERRAVVTAAEGKKKAMELEAEGKRRSWELDAEGRKYATELTAHADKIKVELDAQGTKNAAALIANIDPTILEYTVRMSHISMMQRLATEGKHSTYFVPKDMSALPAWADLFSNKK